MPDVKVPLLGKVPKPALIMGVGGGIVVGGYLLLKHKQNAAASDYGYGAGGYGEGESGYYSYGSEFAYGGNSGYGGSVTPYPVGSEYGYGAFGYGYYNPYTGQWQGPGQQGPPVAGGGGSTGGTGGGTGGGGTGGGDKTHTITANGHDDIWRTAIKHGISPQKLVKLNPQLRRLVGTGKPIPKGTKVKV